MADRAALKAELLELCRKTDGGFKTANVPWLDRIEALMHELAAISPEREPLTSPHFDGRWVTEFASFGIKPEEGKGIRRETDLMFNSFGKLPSAAIFVTDMYQDVDRETAAYNNVVDFDIPGSGIKGAMTMLGQFAADDDNALRAVVSFSAVSAAARDAGSSEADFRAALGIDAEPALDVSFKPPRLHSDVVYLDEDLRINIGSVGGNYVLSKVSATAPTAVQR